MFKPSDVRIQSQRDVGDCSGSSVSVPKPAPAQPNRFSSSLIVGESVSLNVFADVIWNSTSLTVQPGEEYDITATGEWSHGPGDQGAVPNPYGPDGPTVRAHYADRSPYLAHLPQEPVGVLVGRIDSGEPFHVGSHTVLSVQDYGELLLGINEVAETFGDDNVGSLQVTIQRLPAQP